MVSSTELTAVAANEVWRKRHNMTVNEQRLLLWLIAQVDPFSKAELPQVTLTAREFFKLGGTKAGGSVYNLLETTTGELMDRKLVVREEEGWKSFHWLLRARYNDGKGTMTLQLHPDLRPYLCDLKERFAGIPLAPAMRLRGNYAISFFEYCCSWYGSKTKMWEMTNDALREWLEIKDGELTHISHLRVRVIEQAQKELDEKCPFSFVYEPLKNGRKIVGWRFSVVDNKPCKRVPKKAVVEITDMVSSRDPRHERAKHAWLHATSEQREEWLAAMPECKMMVPKRDEEPRLFFLSALSEVLEPVLAL